MTTITAPQAKLRNDAGVSAFDEGVLQIRNGTTLLVEFDLGDPAFGASTEACPSVATANGLPIAATAESFGSTPLAANNARVLTSAAVVHYEVASGQIGTTGSGLAVQLSNTTITEGQAVQLTAFTLTQPCSS